MPTAAIGGSYKPLTGPYASSSADLVLSLIPESSSLSSSTPPEVNVTTHLRAALRAAQASLNEECTKTANAKLVLEKTDAEYVRLQLEKRTLARAVNGFQVDDGGSVPDLPGTEEFQEYCQARTDPLPGPDDPYYEHAIKKARYEFELQEIEQREEQYATLQAKLEELQQNSSLLKKKAIIADSSLTELHETMAKVKAALEDVSLPTPVEAQPIEDDVEMESSTEGGEVEVEAEAEADVETASS